jgi:hypothetical protein
VTRRTRSARTLVAATALAAALTVLGACGGRTDGGTPIPSGGEGEATTSTTGTTLPGS